MKSLLDAATLIRARTADPRGAAAFRMNGAGDADVTPQPLVGLRMAEFALLAGVPLRYLVPDPGLLPDNAIRFFTLNPDWLADLRAGILSIGLGDEATRVTAQADAVTGAALPLVRDMRRGRPVGEPAGGPRSTVRPGAGVCGFLLRSGLVERWPDMIVRAYTGAVPDDVDPDSSPLAAALTPLRLERLTPSVLVALWATAPDLILIQEPAGAPRHGIDRTDAGPAIRVRRADGTETGATVPVPVDGSGVIDLVALAAALAGAGHITDPGDPAALAMQLLQPPVRRRFRRAAP